jgi:hypothetical protein
MTRPKARALDIAERLADQIKRHAQEHPDLWWQTPRTILAEVSGAWDGLPTPLVMVMVSDSEASEGGSIELQNDLLKLSLVLKTTDSKSPQRAILELVADVRRAVMDNRQMEDAGGTPYLQCGQIMDKGYTVATEFAEGGAGTGLAEYRLEADYQWTPATA